MNTILGTDVLGLGGVRKVFCHIYVICQQSKQHGNQDEGGTVCIDD